MKSIVRLAPGKPEVMLYWADPGHSTERMQLRGQRKQDRRSWLRHEAEDLDDWKEEPVQSHRRRYALPR